MGGYFSGALESEVPSRIAGSTFLVPEAASTLHVQGSRYRAKTPQLSTRKVERAGTRLGRPGCTCLSMF
jgi:hypothetical protein